MTTSEILRRIRAEANDALGQAKLLKTIGGSEELKRAHTETAYRLFRLLVDADDYCEFDVIVTTCWLARVLGLWKEALELCDMGLATHPLPEPREMLGRAREDILKEIRLYEAKRSY